MEPDETYFKQWAELFTGILLLIGFLLSIITQSALINYIVIFLTGLMSGRFIFKRLGQPMFPFFLILFGFLIGYIVGAINFNKWIIISLYIIGTYGSYKLHKHNIIGF